MSDPPAVTIGVTCLGRPPTINRMYGLTPFAKNRLVTTWRQTATVLWRQQLIPGRRFLSPIRVVATPLHRDRRSPQDVGACAPALKAAIDGLRDTGALADDDPAHLHAVTYLRPEVVGADGLRIEVYGELSSAVHHRRPALAITGSARRP